MQAGSPYHSLPPGEFSFGCSGCCCLVPLFWGFVLWWLGGSVARLPPPTPNRAVRCKGKFWTADFETFPSLPLLAKNCVACLRVRPLTCKSIGVGPVAGTCRFPVLAFALSPAAGPAGTACRLRLMSRAVIVRSLGKNFLTLALAGLSE